MFKRSYMYIVISLTICLYSMLSNSLNIHIHIRDTNIQLFHNPTIAVHFVCAHEFVFVGNSKSEVHEPLFLHRDFCYSIKKVDAVNVTVAGKTNTFSLYHTRFEKIVPIICWIIWLNLIYHTHILVCPKGWKLRPDV